MLLAEKLISATNGVRSAEAAELGIGLPLRPFVEGVPKSTALGPGVDGTGELEPDLRPRNEPLPVEGAGETNTCCVFSKDR